MSSIRTPGVYVKEITSLPPSVEEVKTSVPAFIGYTEKAEELAADDLRFIPHKITSLMEYKKWYGVAGTTAAFILYHSMELYFANGGGDCYIVSIGGYNNNQQIADFIKGLDAINKIDEPTLLLFPDAVNLPGNDLYDVQKAALNQAANLGDRFCILDLKFADTNNKHADVVSEFRRNIGNDRLKFGAAYTPYLKVTIGSTIVLPPSAAIAGVYCSVDNARGVWKAPANVSLNMINEVAYTIDNNEQDNLNVDLNEGKSINAIRKFTGHGILIWGARTLAGNDNEWRYISVRRFFIMVEESVKKSCMPFVFEPNIAATWVRMKSMIENYLLEKWREGALAGARPEDAFFVQIGLGQTMTAQDVLEGKIIVQIGMAAVRPAEFIIINFSIKMQEG